MQVKISKWKMRRLASKTSDQDTLENNRSWFCQVSVIAAFVISIAVFLAVYCFPEFELTNFLNSLHDNYEQQYNSIVQGNPEYCRESLKADKMFFEIGQEVLNQKQGLAKMEQLFNNSTTFRGILVAGPPGVGKTLFGEHFFNLFTLHFLLMVKKTINICQTI